MLPLIPPKPGVDLVGLAVLLGYVLFWAIYMAYHAVKKRKAMKHTDTLLAGAVRYAAARGDLAALEALSHAPGFDVNSADGGFTALHAACIQGHRDVVLWLCQRGADVHAIKEDGWNDTALHYAAANGNLGSVQVLLAYGGAFYVKNSFGLAARDIAEARHHTSIVEYLEAIEKASIDPPVPSELEGWAPLASSSSKGSVPSRSPLGDGSSEHPSSGTAGSTSAGSTDLEAGSGAAPTRALDTSPDAPWRKLIERAWEGIGSEGTEIHPKQRTYRIIVVLMQCCLVAYVVWRALRSLPPGWYYFYSIPAYIAELTFYPFSFVFILSLWWWIRRPDRWVGDILQEDQLPSVDVYIVRCAEPMDVLEPTVIAALNMNWPGKKLAVHILDDGVNKETRHMVRRLRGELRSMGREARLVYVSRRKRKGVPHHAKAGNINHAVLNSQGRGDYILVLDTDMIVHPDFLQHTMGHFYRKAADGDGWVPKEKCAFLQVPQDFYNIAANDPLGHGARLFYGPMFQGRDGAGAAPCCGTGVIFPRTSLVSIGGQSYGSITEDYYTSFKFFASGFSSMYVNKRIVFGQAPETIVEVLKQRLRWATGALQILFKTNPLDMPGLTAIQALLAWESGAYHFSAFSMVFFMFVPIVYVFSQVSPVTAWHLWEFVAAWSPFWLLNRVMWLYISHGEYGGEVELWRLMQTFVWQAANNCKAIWTVVTAEVPLLKRLFGKEITFKITEKRSTTVDPEESKRAQTRKAIYTGLPYLLYYFIVFVSTVYVIVSGAIGMFTTSYVIANFCGLIWTYLNCWCLWPLVATMMPRRETAYGWQVEWRQFVPASLARAASRMVSGTVDTMKSLRHTLSLSRGLSIGPSQTSALRDANRQGTLPTVISMAQLAPPGDGRGKTTPKAATSGDLREHCDNRTAPNLAPPVSRKSSNAPVLKSGEQTSSSFANVGRVALPLRGALSLQNSTLLTSLVLPERVGYSSDASRQPSMLLMTPDGEVCPVNDQSALAQLSRRDGTSQTLSSHGSDASLPGVVMQPNWLSPVSSEYSFVKIDAKGGLRYHGHAAGRKSHDLARAFEAAHHLAAVEEETEKGVSDPSSIEASFESGSCSSEDPNPRTGMLSRAPAGALDGIMGLTEASPLGELLQLTGDETLSLAVITKAANKAPLAAHSREPARRVSFEAGASKGDKAAAHEDLAASTWEVVEAEHDFVSPFGVEAQRPFTDSSTPGETTPHGASSVEGAELYFSYSRQASAARVPSAAQARVRQVSRALVDIVGSLTPMGSKLLSTTSAVVVPVVPSSIFMHSIGAKPSFERRELPSRNFNFIILSLALTFGLAGLAVWSALNSK